MYKSVEDKNSRAFFPPVPCEFDLTLPDLGSGGGIAGLDGIIRPEKPLII